MPSLPFDKRCTLQEVGGEAVLEEMPIALWPQRGTNDVAGRYYDYEGEAPQEHYEDLRVANRQIVHDGVTYTIIEAVSHGLIPHVALRLRRVV